MSSTGLALTADGADVACHAFAPLSIAWGREHPGDSFEPRRAVVTFDDVGAPEKGAHVVASLNAPASNPRWETAVGTWAGQVGSWAGQRVLIVVFRGRVTDASAGWETVQVDGEPGPRWGALVDVTAVDPLAELANLPVGDTPWPSESVSARAARIEALTPLVWVTDPSAVLVAARDVDSQPAADLLDDLAHGASLAGGLFYDPNSQRARFLLDAARNSLVPAVIISACSISADAQLTSSAADVVNDVTVTYRSASDPDAEPQARYVDAQSVAEAGRRTRSISTELVTPADASKRAQAEAVRYGVPLDKWVEVKLSTRLGDLSRDAAQVLLSAGPAVRVRLVDLPAPAAPTWEGYVEGWALEVDADDWDLTVDLSPAAWSGPLLSWATAPAAQTWAQTLRPWSWADSLSEIPHA